MVLQIEGRQVICDKKIKSRLSNDSRRAVSVTVALVCLLSAGLNTSCLGQGATGGVIGKQNKDASGGSDAAPAPRQAAPKRAPRPVQSETPHSTGTLTAASISGHWKVAVTCVDGSDVWTFEIREESATSFTGDYGPGGGKITNGSINGNEVALVTQTAGQRIWTGTLSGSGSAMRIRGTMTGLGIKTWSSGNCRFDATKG